MIPATPIPMGSLPEDNGCEYVCGARQWKSFYAFDNFSCNKGVDNATYVDRRRCVRDFPNRAYFSNPFPAQFRHYNMFVCWLEVCLC